MVSACRDFLFASCYCYHQGVGCTKSRAGAALGCGNICLPAVVLKLTGKTDGRRLFSLPALAPLQCLTQHLPAIVASPRDLCCRCWCRCPVGCLATTSLDLTGVPVGARGPPTRTQWCQGTANGDRMSPVTIYWKSVRLLDTVSWKHAVKSVSASIYGIRVPSFQQSFRERLIYHDLQEMLF